MWMPAMLVASIEYPKARPGIAPGALWRDDFTYATRKAQPCERRKRTPPDCSRGVVVAVAGYYLLRVG
jgi:hypothetical protein